MIGRFQKGKCCERVLVVHTRRSLAGAMSAIATAQMADQAAAASVVVGMRVSL